MKKKRRIVAQKEEATEEACGGRLSHESRVEDEGQDVPGPINCTRRSPFHVFLSISYFFPPTLSLFSSFLPSNKIAFVLFRRRKKKFLEREKFEEDLCIWGEGGGRFLAISRKFHSCDLLAIIPFRRGWMKRESGNERILTHRHRCVLNAFKT